MAASYLHAHHGGLLDERIRRAIRWMRKCTLCPRMCRVNRLEGEKGFCQTGRHAYLSSYGPHFGEESPLVGRGGSGTMFFTHCNLMCSFCQNYDISHDAEGTPLTPKGLAIVMTRLQAQGCHNINFVTPSHVIPQILEALPLAIEAGLHVPLVYNCGGYERVPALKLLDGIVDIYMPDFKFWDEKAADETCAALDYPRRARAALREMHRQVGDLVLDDSGIATRGLLVRHLVMPEGMAGTAEIAAFIAGEISPNTYINVMAQYRPCGEVVGHSRLGRRVSRDEYEEAVWLARRAGLERLDERRPVFTFP